MQRFDSQRLSAVSPGSVTARSCARTAKLVAACRLGAGPATRPWAEPFAPVRIEWPFGVFQVDDAEIARRACLQLDGSWRLADAGTLGRVGVRAQALLADALWWRALQPGDAWDTGTAADPGALLGFVPRRATLILIEGEPDEAGRRALDDLQRRAETLPRAVRVLVVGGAHGAARHIPA
jgi:hypothetical protein